MKTKLSLKAITLALALASASAGFVRAQTAAPQQEKEKHGGVMGAIFGQDPKAKKDAQEKTAAVPTPTPVQGKERLEPDDTSTLPAGASPEMQAGRREQASEEDAAILPYYNMFLTTYRLGPEDVISVSITGQERYSRAGITVPPDGKISYPLIPGGILVVGKTTEQVRDEIKKRLDEYIIDPDVTVTLEKAVSATYSVIGDVAQPGVRTMTRRYSIMDALALAGGVLNTGDKGKVFILRKQADGNVRPIPVNVKEIERGRAKEMAFLVPGDQVIVPGNTFKKIKQWTDLLSIVSFARIFTGGW